MRKIIPLLLGFLLFSTNVYSDRHLPTLFLFLGGDQPSLYQKQLNNSYIAGAQIIYSWKQLEPKKDSYDFSKIENDLRFLSKQHKQLFIQIQDRSFAPTIYNVPDYIREEKIYHGGVAMQYDFPGEGKPITVGWVARVWDPNVQKRFLKLIQKLAQEFDGKIYAINLPETAVDFDQNNPPDGFTSDNYFNAELKNIAYTRQVFQHSHVLQYVNFFPGEWNNDHQYMSKLFLYAKTHHIGLGGPDIVPYKKSQMQNSYPFFHKMKNKIITAMAIQEPDYTYKNPATGEGYTFNEFYDFAQNYLGAQIIIWNVQEPFFSTELMPNINGLYFKP